MAAMSESSSPKQHKVAMVLNSSRPVVGRTALDAILRLHSSVGPFGRSR
jgi:hypothetical protein